MAERSAQSKREAPLKAVLFSPLLQVTLALGICVHLGGFLIFRVVSNPLPSRESEAPFVRYLSSEESVTGPEFEERALLFDSAPLFVPGVWNAAYHLTPPPRNRRLFRFESYRPPEDFASALLPSGVPFGKDYGVEEPEDLLQLSSWDLYRGLARETDAPEPLEATKIFADVRSVDGAWSQTVPIEIDLQSAQAMQPAVYFLRIEAGGRALGRPTLSVSSGDAAFDAAVYNWLAESGFSAGLPAGLMQISVYP